VQQVYSEAVYNNLYSNRAAGDLTIHSDLFSDNRKGNYKKNHDACKCVTGHCLYSCDVIHNLFTGSTLRHVNIGVIMESTINEILIRERIVSIKPMTKIYRMVFSIFFFND
jgi:hypothetical protein